VRQLDLVVIVAYLALIAALGARLAGRQRSTTDYFVGGRSLPWWAVCLSIVATETTALTVVSVPGVAYTGSFSFAELAVGYLIGRVVVAAVLLPLYVRGDLVSAYQLLGRRFGPSVQGLASLTFLVTRLLGEGVRLFASAIPIKLLLGSIGIPADYFVIILVLTAVTVGYTYLGGMRAVVWTNVAQVPLYVGGALLSVGILLGKVGGHGVAEALHGGKLTVFDLGWNLGHILTSPYAFLTAILGGAVFAMASHGSDQLVVQRVLACRSLSDARKAMVGSGVLVLLQLAVLSMVGVLVWAYHGGGTVADLGLSSSDQIYPSFILRDLPAGVSGLLVAGVLAATMGSLSSALNTMATSTVVDLLRPRWHRTVDETWELRAARVLTQVWAAVFVVFASLFSDTTNQVIVLGLGITGYTYGALLGSFLLALLVRRADQADAVIAFLVTVAVLAFVVLRVRLEVDGNATGLAFPWLAPLGAAVTLAVGGLLSRRHPRPRPVVPPA
jgi:SSS family transporter